ncbi:MAG: hypothetical protein PUG15_01215 [Bacteroidales bacterium]|nr:hypothetical protein [Bacteroidales bacterium]
MKEYKVVQQTSAMFSVTNSQKYAFFVCREYANICGKTMKNNGSEAYEALIKIKNKKTGKEIYRKFFGSNQLCNYGTETYLDYRTMQELGVRPCDMVEVSKAYWFAYYWCNSEKGIRAPFRWGIVGLTLSVIGVNIKDLICIFL